MDVWGGMGIYVCFYIFCWLKYNAVVFIFGGVACLKHWLVAGRQTESIELCIYGIICAFFWVIRTVSPLVVLLF